MNEDNTIETLVKTFWDVQPLSAAKAASLITCTRGEVATLVKRILSVSPGDGLQAWFAVTQWSKPRSVVEQAASMAEGEDEDANTVQLRGLHDRSNQKHKQESDNERKPFNRRTANSSPSASPMDST